jgi:CO/xanthine dehydrogenase Mo-binding subunit
LASTAPPCARATASTPGVHAVAIWADLGPAGHRSRSDRRTRRSAAGASRCSRPTASRFVGKPVAIVIAERRHAAEDVAELGDVAYEPLPSVQDPRTPGPGPVDDAVPAISWGTSRWAAATWRPPTGRAAERSTSSW